MSTPRARSHLPTAASTPLLISGFPLLGDSTSSKHGFSYKSQPIPAIAFSVAAPSIILGEGLRCDVLPAHRASLPKPRYMGGTDAAGVILIIGFLFHSPAPLFDGSLQAYGKPSGTNIIPSANVLTY